MTSVDSVEKIETHDPKRIFAKMTSMGMAYSAFFPDILSRSCRQSFMQNLMGHCMKI